MAYKSALDRPLEDRSKGRLDWNFEHSTPPKNYVCNRCGKKGHHLQACPTNMDPAYDEPPGADYFCPLCHKSGEHYKSLCPRNTDPYSIVQKRLAAKIGQDKKENMVDAWGHARIGTQLEKDTERGQMYKKQKVDDFDEWDTSMENDKGPKTPVKRAGKKHHTFVEGLVQAIGSSMTETVNAQLPRPTALQMWVEDDKIRDRERVAEFFSTYVPPGCETGRLTPYGYESEGDLSPVGISPSTKPMPRMRPVYSKESPSRVASAH